MGLAGKQPLSNARKALDAVQITRMNNETPAPGEPQKPSQLTGYALEFWNRYVPQLVALGMAGEIDTPALTQLATYWGVWQRTADELDEADMATTQGSRLFNNHIRAGEGPQSPLIRSRISYDQVEPDRGR